MLIEQMFILIRGFMFVIAHIELEQVASDSQLPANMCGKIIDHVWYVQENMDHLEKKQEKELWKWE